MLSSFFEPPLAIFIKILRNKRFSLHIKDTHGCNQGTETNQAIEKTPPCIPSKVLFCGPNDGILAIITRNASICSSKQVVPDFCA